MNIIFTHHALEKIHERRITKDEVLSTIKYPEETRKIGDKYYVQKNIGRGVIQVVFTRERYIKVITIHWMP